MNITIIHFGGIAEQFSGVKDFEFRTNHVANWIRLKFKDGHTEMVRSIVTIKTF